MSSAFLTPEEKAATLSGLLARVAEAGGEAGPGSFDPPMLPWVARLNQLEGLATVESCSGHQGGEWFLELWYGTYEGIGRETEWVIKSRTVVWPKVSPRQPIPNAVPEPFASLAREAGLTLADSPRASAALSRRCLQQILRDVAGAPPSDLFREIEWAIANANLPSHAREGLHDLREIGNMAAHPNKSTATGEYLEVEPGEADWTLDVLDALFDHYFIGPARTAARRAALDAKLGRTR